MKALRYLKARLKEKTTWAGIGGVIAGASVLTPPWDTVAVVIGVLMVFAPEPGKAE